MFSLEVKLAENQKQTMSKSQWAFFLFAFLWISYAGKRNLALV